VAAPRLAVVREATRPAPTEHVEVFVCSGCGIGEALDAERLAAVSEGELQRPGRVRPPLCVPENLAILQSELAEAGATRAVIAACSERVNYDVFSPEFLEVNLVGRVNVRELVAWSKPPGEPETQALAEDYLRMGITRAQRTRLPAPREREVDTSVLVVGGGVTGLTAALEAAGAGHDVFLVEKEPRLGGWTARFAALFPTRPPYRELEPVDVDATIAAVLDHPRITVMTGASISSISGEPGELHVAVDQDGCTVDFTTGAVVLATGWQPDEGRLSHLGLGELPDVITNVAFEEMVGAGGGVLARPSDGQPARRVAIVCRPRPGEDGDYSYGANVLDMASLKHALYVTRSHPEARAYVIYEDIVTPGQYEAFYRRVSEEPNVHLAKGRVTAVTAASGGRMLLRLEDSLLGPNVGLPVDLVVLAVGMVPTTAGEPILNLLYKQGPGLPTAKFGFSDSNFICFPYETRRTGLYAAGSVREPMDVALSAEDATGAALKAIQSLELISSGKAAHPRTGDLSLPITFYQGCTRCGRCSEECPFSAIETDKVGYPILNPDRCRRCGICMGACPVQVISFEDYSVGQLSAMVKSIRFPTDPGLPRILALCCENDAYPAFDLAGINRLHFDASVRVVPLRCLGSLNVAVVADALSNGIDGILLMGCKSGDDYQCHFIQGSALAARRMENVRETLSRLMIERERVRPVEVEISEYDRLPALVGSFVEEVKAMGPNPYRGF
jgi:quinone-modifying oxidoreductase subunit QmoB